MIKTVDRHHDNIHLFFYSLSTFLWCQTRAFLHNVRMMVYVGVMLMLLTSCVNVLLDTEGYTVKKSFHRAQLQ